MKEQTKEFDETIVLQNIVNTDSIEEMVDEGVVIENVSDAD